MGPKSIAGTRLLGWTIGKFFFFFFLQRHGDLLSLQAQVPILNLKTPVKRKFISPRARDIGDADKGKEGADYSILNLY